jgi:DNA-binding CsgD family transcriptional regulator
MVGSLALFVHGWCCFWLAPSVFGLGRTPAIPGGGEEVGARRTGSRFRYAPSAASAAGRCEYGLLQTNLYTPAYYAALEQVRLAGEDLSRWLEYSAEGLKQTLERVWIRVQRFQASSKERMVLTPKQEKLIGLLGEIGSLSPSEIWAQLSVSKQGALKLMRPLIDAGMIVKHGSAKTGRYFLP